MAAPGGDTFTTLNVDGGVTDNDPFQLAHDYLAVHNPLAQPDPDTGELRNPTAQNEANCAVLTVAPFPAKDSYEDKFNFAANSSIFGMLPNLFTALISQSRFQGESLSAVIDTSSYSCFVLAPSDFDNPGEGALQCGRLSAFGGFFERGFRAHDYQLGRRNCQKFLRDTFRLSVDNPIIAAGLQDLSSPDSVIGDFKTDPAETVATLPIIPLCGSAAPEVPAPVRATIASDRVDQVVDWVVGRLRAVARPLIEDAIKPRFQNQAAKAAAETLISTVGKAKLREILQRELQAVIAP